VTLTDQKRSSFNLSYKNYKNKITSPLNFKIYFNTSSLNRDICLDKIIAEFSFNKKSHLYYSRGPCRLKTSFCKPTPTHTQLYPEKSENYSDSLNHTATIDTQSATTTPPSSVKLTTPHGTLAKTKSQKQSSQRITLTR
jgi:hypothetical protein